MTQPDPGCEDPGCVDTERDTLAFLAASWSGDADGISVIVASASVPMVAGMLAGMLYMALQGQDIDPAEWVAAQQARVRDELAGLRGG